MTKNNRFQNNNDMPVELVLISEIIPDEMFRVRIKECPYTIKKYAERVEEYKEAQKNNPEVRFPFDSPVVYWQYGNKKILIAGFHRYFAAKKVELKRIPAVRFTAGNS